MLESIEEGERLSVEEAAQRLGISARAVRFRIERGELAGVKVGKSWQVVLSGKKTMRAETRASGNESGNGNGNGSGMAGRNTVAKDKRHPFGASRPAETGNSASVSGRKGKSFPQWERKGAVGKAAGSQPVKDLRQLAAFGILRNVYIALEQTPEAASHRVLIHAALREVTRGYYQWRKESKLASYNAARLWVADALLELVLVPLHDEALGTRLFKELENDALSSLIGLSRRFESKKPSYGDD